MQSRPAPEWETGAWISFKRFNRCRQINSEDGFRHNFGGRILHPIS
jgi:hypothetical protein